MKFWTDLTTFNADYFIMSITFTFFSINEVFLNTKQCRCISAVWPALMLLRIISIMWTHNREFSKIVGWSGSGPDFCSVGAWFKSTPGRRLSWQFPLLYSVSQYTWTSPQLRQRSVPCTSSTYSLLFNQRSNWCHIIQVTWYNRYLNYR
jgi:hypothetical protein